ncbi:MAG TPA: DUF3299 domain-containing protein [Candidatus Hydrogenedentes bacterium]|nr:DUF3299 domain-containing protein [Candidatus Hydrogenedentota bacterium]
MRRRTKQEFVVIIGVVLLLVAVVLVNGYFQRSSLTDKMEAIRKKVEEGRKTEGLDLLPWPLLQKTTGTMSKGPSFDERLLKYDQQHVDIVGFMVPLEQFRNMTEFLVLPVPIECYFCQSPPMRDVVVVQMEKGKGTNLYREPVLINGILNLKQGPNTKFFYIITEANMGPGKRGGKLTIKDIAPQHMIPGHQPTPTPQDELQKPLAAPEPVEEQ